MEGQVKKSSKVLWWIVVLFAVLLGLISSVVTIGTITYFEHRKVILSDNNTEKDRNLKADEQMLFSEKGVKVTFLGFNKGDSPFGNTIDFEIENSNNKEISVSYDYLKINGIVVEAVLHERVPARKTVKVGSTIESLLHEIKIDKIEDLSFQLNVYDGDYLSYGEFNIPTNYYGTIDQEAVYQNKRQIVNEKVNDGEIIISYLPDLTVGTDQDEKHYVMIENNTDSRIGIMSSGAIYNGKTVKELGFMPEDLPPRSKSIEPVKIDVSDDIAQLVGGKIDTFELLLSINGGKESGSRYDLENIRMKIK